MMRFNRTKYVWVTIFGLVLLLGTACGNTTLPEISAEELVQLAAERMKESEGFQFTIERDGAPAYLDPGETLSFRRATGAYVAPDRALATVRVIGPVCEHIGNSP